LVDGGFYRKRAKYLWGEKSGADRAKELHKQLQEIAYENHENLNK
jgi:hypothetical protein